ncbi:IQ motif and ankyrin repeat domain-containing protein 1-like isoform X2 [Hypanus sabinus]|uniref:IQ motif and ankyrin repeat domain-containing protein 1-like isoform X2 n=1 Tax=Hypanus sabinus TaxID=79690 RepID=UPI0028C4802F|nr:IQ motif and ankyrin repeat domain-containing protein 1-like isoform X2 [Hypanus sabinus]
MSSRKSKSGAGKATKKSIQPARRDLGAHPPTKNPSTSGRNKSKNDKGMLAPDVAHVKGEGTIEARSAITIQCAFRQYLARKERARRLREKKEFEEQMEKLEREAFIALVRREQEAAAREREKEEVERRRRQEEQKRRYRMLEAAFEGDVEEIQSILKEVSELDTKDGVAFDEIGQVLRRRHQLDMVDCTDAHGNTPLSEAAGGGHPSAIKFLIEKGANPNSKGVYGRTPLYRAAFGGHVAAVQTLLQSGADPRISAEDGTMPVEVAPTDPTLRTLQDWDISTTVLLRERLEADLQRRREAEKRQKEEEADRIQSQVSELTKELSQYQHELQKAYCELHKRINEHDKCVSKDTGKTNITLQAVHDAEELLAVKRSAAAEAEQKLSLAKLQLRERLQREASLTELKRTLCHIRELDDVLLKDVGDKIKQDGRWPLIIDPSGQASTFLRYRDTNFHNALNPSHMKPEVLRLGLLGAIRYGKMLVIDMMEVNMFQVVTAVFEQIQAGLMERLLSKELLQKDGFLSLIQPGDGPEYSRNEFSPSRVEKFQLVLLTKQQTLAKELLSVFYPIQIIIQ